MAKHIKYFINYVNTPVKYFIVQVDEVGQLCPSNESLVSSRFFFFHSQNMLFLQI